MSNRNIIEIGILLYPAAQLATVLGLTDLFVFAQRIASERGATDTPTLRISQWQMQSPHESPVRIQDSLPGTNTRPAVLILPPSLEEPIATSAAAPYREWLQEQHRDGTTLASVCAGAFLLGETGVLSGRTITTHWLYVEKFTERFPACSSMSISSSSTPTTSSPLAASWPGSIWDCAWWTATWALR